MEDKLRGGTTLIVDRYSYSGVAFSSAKGLDTEWCKVISGLPQDCSLISASKFNIEIFTAGSRDRVISSRSGCIP